MTARCWENLPPGWRTAVGVFVDVELDAIVPATLGVSPAESDA